MENIKRLIKFLKAFSIVEVIVTIIIISAVTAAFAPVFTKKVDKTTVEAVGGDQITLKCSPNLPDECKSCFPRHNPTTCLDCDEEKLTCEEKQAVNPTACACQDCPENCKECTFNAKGEAICKDCDPGYYWDEVNKMCTECPTGHYCPDDGNNEKLECDLGTYQDLTGQTECKNCPCGTYQNKKAQTSCDECNNGKYCPETNSTEVSTCPAGTYSPATGPQCTCTDCANGYYQDQAGKSSCKKCNNGYFCNLETGKTDRVPCEEGRYSTSDGSCNSDFGTCQDCNKDLNPGLCLGLNAWNSSQSTGVLLCDFCKDGYCANGTGKTSCTKCATGNQICGRRTCEITGCKNGFNFSCSNACNKCSKDYYIKNGECTPCPAGQVTDNCNTATSCTTPACPVITGCLAYNNSTCKCTKCNCGYYLNNGTCTACGKGKYSAANTVGAANCSTCPAGTYCPDNATCIAVNCGVGKYNPNTGSTAASACVNCSAGTYNDVARSASCKCCGTGKGSPVGATAASQCTNCSCGQYATNCGACTSCGTGKYSAEGAANCTPCPKGAYCNKANTCPTTIANCGVGKYNPNTGSTAASACVNCAANKYNNVVRNASCANCGDGKWSLPGATTCRNCPVGCKVCTNNSGSNTASSNCTTCNSGWFKHTNNKCYYCRKGTARYGSTLRCVTTKNMGDDQTNFKWPSTVSHGSGKSVTASSNVAYCWTGITTASTATTVNNYSGAKRTVCTYYGGDAYCRAYGGTLVSEDYMQTILKTSSQRKKFNICSNYAITNAARCVGSTNCKNYSAPSTTDNHCLPNDYLFSASGQPWIQSGDQRWIFYFKNVQESSVQKDANKAHAPRSARCEFPASNTP